MTLDIYTIDGGEIIYETLKAVSLCLNGGQGVLHGLIRIGTISGLFIIYYMFVMRDVEYIAKKWGIPVSMMLSFLFVPQTTVWIHDDVSKFHRKLDHVPMGLGQFASQVSKIGKALTSAVEQAFSLPDDLKYNKAGMVCGSDILEKAKEFKIVNQNFRENVKNFVGQCVKYDIMLNNKYTFDQLRDSNNLWELVSSNPSKVRGMFWIPIEVGKATYITCDGAVKKFNAVWKAELDRISFAGAKRMFTGRSIGHSSLTSNKLVMSPQLMTALKNEFMMNLQSTYSSLGDLAYTAEEALKQNVMINALNDSASENARNAGNPLSYAEMKALLQQNYTFDTIGRLAAKVLPLMKAVLEALVYACFIFIIPLCMLPSGYRFLLNWSATLVWLSFWSPVYAILNMIMNIAARASSVSEIGMSKGITIANVVGLSSANAEIKVLAGYLALSVPFICIALVKGVGSFIHLAGQMTGATTSAAGGAVGEIVNGNMSYSNVSFGNAQMGNASELQRNHNSLIASGGHKLDTGGVMIINDAKKDLSVRQQLQDTGRRMVHSTVVDTTSQTNALKNLQSDQKSLQTHFSNTKTTATNQRAQLSESISNMSVNEIANSVDGTTSEAKNIAKAAQDVRQYLKSKQYTSGTSAHAGTGTGGGMLPVNAGASAQASNAQSFGDSENTVSEERYNESAAIIDNYAHRLAQSKRDDATTRNAKDLDHSLQEMHSLQDAMNINQAKIDQMESAIQHMQSSTVTVSSNANEEYARIAQKQNPNLTLNQAKEQLQNADANDPAHQRVLQAMQKRNMTKYNTEAARFKAPDVSDINFTKEDLNQKYEAQKATTENEMNAIQGNITTKQATIRQKMKTSEQTFKTKNDEALTKIQTGQNTVTNKKEQIKNVVDKRAKEGTLKAVGKVVIGRDNYDKKTNKK